MTQFSATGRWQRIESLFYAALDLEPAARPAFLENACGQDAGLRLEIESLLDSSENTAGFLQRPVAQAAEQVTAATEPGKRIGAYELRGVLGEGGMGKVYLASRADKAYRQDVALKVMHAGFGESRRMLLRFTAERQILANLNHPNIARLLDGGMTAEGLSFLVMECAIGVPINEFCHRQQLTIEQRLRLFCTVCSAVEYAHKNLVVHRDIKPANVLVTAEGVPKLLDFGIAKLLEPGAGEPALTRTSERLMTPEYASPEQVRGEPINTSTDVYALGILLYELLAGRRPFQSDTGSPLEVVRLVCEQEPEAPSVMSARSPLLAAPDAARKLRGDLDNIILTAIRKEAARRYASVAGLAGDVQAYLNGYPVQARTDSWRYRSGKFVGRHTAAVTAAAGMALALVGFSAAMGWLARRANREQDIAKQEERFLASMFQAATPEEARGRTLTARELLDRGARRIDSELTGEPVVRASLLHEIAQAYLNLGLYDQAEARAQQSYDLRAKNLGTLNPETADTLEVLGTVLRDKGEFQKAEPLFRQLLKAREQTSRQNLHPVVDSLGDLGDCLYQEQKDAEAEAVLRRALVLDRPRSAQTTGAVRVYLAWVLERRGDFAEAASLLREAVDIDRRTEGADGPNYANSLHNLASVLIDLGDLTDAEAKLRDTLAIRRRILGNENPDLGYTLNNLGYLLLEKGDWRAAEPLLKENLDLGLRQLGPNHPRIAAFRNNWARVLLAKGDYRGAEMNFRLAVDILQRAGSGVSWPAAQILSNIGLLAFDRGRYPTAEQWARQSLEMRRKLGGEKTPAFASSLMELAEYRLVQDDPKSAVPMLRQALAIRQQKYSRENPAVISAEVRLGEALTAEGSLGQAEPVLRQALAAVHASPFPLLPWQVAEAESTMGYYFCSVHRYSEAEPLLSKSEAGLQTYPELGMRRHALGRVAGLTAAIRQAAPKNQTATYARSYR